MSEPESPAEPVVAPLDPLSRAHELLRAAQAADAAHGVAPRLLLLELVRGLAADLVGHFATLPGHKFTGLVRRSPRTIGLMLPPRMIAHRVLLGRYLHYTPPVPATPKYARSVARIAVLALGADGALRRGVFAGAVIFPGETEPPTDPLAYDDVFLANVPPWPLIMRDWAGSVDSREVAGPIPVLDVLSGLVQRVWEGTAEEQELVKVLLQHGNA